MASFGALPVEMHLLFAEHLLVHAPPRRVRLETLPECDLLAPLSLVSLCFTSRWCRSIYGRYLLQARQFNDAFIRKHKYDLYLEFFSMTSISSLSHTITSSACFRLGLMMEHRKLMHDVIKRSWKLVDQSKRLEALRTGLFAGFMKGRDIKIPSLHIERFQRKLAHCERAALKLGACVERKNAKQEEFISAVWSRAAESMIQRRKSTGHSQLFN